MSDARDTWIAARNPVAIAKDRAHRAEVRKSFTEAQILEWGTPSRPLPRLRGATPHHVRGYRFDPFLGTYVEYQLVAPVDIYTPLIHNN